MKTLKFHPDLVDLILDGSKSTTWRLWDDKNISVGDEVSFTDSLENKQFTQAIITEVKEKTFAEMTDDDWEGHERYEDENDLYQSFSKYYNKKVDKYTVVKIIKFKLK